MAAYAGACRRGSKLVTESIGTQFFGSIRLDYRSMSELVKPDGKPDGNHAILVKKLEAQGLPANQAKEITDAINEVLNYSLKNASVAVPRKDDLEKIQTGLYSSLSEIQTEVKESQDRYISWSKDEMEKMKTDLEKMHIDVQNGIEQMRNNNKAEFEKMRKDLRKLIDKVTAGQKLDISLERGRVHDELLNTNKKTTNLTNKVERDLTNVNDKLDEEIHARHAQIEAAKYEVIKYCIGTVVSVSAVGLAVLRVLM